MLTIRSPAFPHGGEIPRLHTCEGKDVPPALEFAGAPQGAKSLALVVHDPDAPDPAAQLQEPRGGGIGRLTGFVRLRLRFLRRLPRLRRDPFELLRQGGQAARDLLRPLDLPFAQYPLALLRDAPFLLVDPRLETLPALRRLGSDRGGSGEQRAEPRGGKLVLERAGAKRVRFRGGGGLDGVLDAPLQLECERGPGIAGRLARLSQQPVHRLALRLHGVAQLVAAAAVQLDPLRPLRCLDQRVDGARVAAGELVDDPERGARTAQRRGAARLLRLPLVSQLAAERIAGLHELVRWDLRQWVAGAHRRQLTTTMRDPASRRWRECAAVRAGAGGDPIR